MSCVEYFCKLCDFHSGSLKDFAHPQLPNEYKCPKCGDERYPFTETDEPYQEMDDAGREGLIYDEYDQ